jgi:DNA invertase Pin-like site-specific DNA recombinase
MLCNIVDLSEADSNKWQLLLDPASWRPSPTPEGATTAPHYGEVKTIRQLQRRFTLEEEHAVIADYRDGGTVYTLAKNYGCHRTTISRRLKSHSVELANVPADQATVDAIVRLYESGLSMDATARETGVSAKTVLNHLRTRSVKTRDSHRRKRQVES